MLGGESGPSTASLDVGRRSGTDIYSPVDGTIVGITPLTLRGQTFGVADRHPADERARTRRRASRTSAPIRR